jgi:hypothetical protein
MCKHTKGLTCDICAQEQQDRMSKTENWLRNGPIYIFIAIGLAFLITGLLSALLG